MGHQLSKWDIVKVIRPPESLGCPVREKVSGQGWYLDSPAAAAQDCGAPGSRLISIRTLYLPKKLVGKEFYIVCPERNDYFEQNLYRIREIDKNKNGFKSTISLPEELLVYSGKRILDIRTLSNGEKTLAFSKVATHSRFSNVTYRTTDNDIRDGTSINMLRKLEQVFFPHKKFTLKSIMVEIIKAANSEKYGMNVFSCDFCGGNMSLGDLATRRYFRKNGGGTTLKCVKCNKTNFIVLDFTKNDGGVFRLSRTNEHRE